MKRIIALLLTAVMTLSVFAGCSTETESTIYKIVTTIYPVYNWLQNLTEGAENVELTLLVGDGKDIHNYQPTAEDMVKINECNYFVYVGGESDQWVNDAADAFFRDNDSKQKVSLLGLLGSRLCRLSLLGLVRPCNSLCDYLFKFLVLLFGLFLHVTYVHDRPLSLFLKPAQS